MFCINRGGATKNDKGQAVKGLESLDLILNVFEVCARLIATRIRRRKTIA